MRSSVSALNVEGNGARVTVEVDVDVFLAKADNSGAHRLLASGSGVFKRLGALRTM